MRVRTHMKIFFSSIIFCAFTLFLTASCSDSITIQEFENVDACQKGTLPEFDFFADKKNKEEKTIISSGDTDCHIDCPPTIFCQKGVVFHTGGSFSCRTGCLYTKLFTCKKGCRKDCHSVITNISSAREACEEGRVKVVGDTCDNNLDCLPIKSSKDQNNKKTHNDYLSCNQDKGICEESTAPLTNKDYMKECSDIDYKRRIERKYGYLHSRSCSSSKCFFEWDFSESCIRMGCSIECTGNHDCPQGSFCHQLTDQTPVDKRIPNLRGSKICIPGVKTSSNSYQINTEKVKCQ